MYSKITNPETGRKVSVFSKKGKLIIKKYLLIGGFIKGSIKIPSDNYAINNKHKKQKKNNKKEMKGGFIRGGVRIPNDNYLDTTLCNN